MLSRILRRVLQVALIAKLSCTSSASDLRSVDASSHPPPPQVGSLQMGSASAGHAPNGNSLSVNSEFLVLNGEPWVPVMGEFHYSRYPADQWLPELQKMKAAGVDIVSTYIIWIHHEEVQDQFIFSGSRNITQFIETAAEVGLSVIARLGPYVHAEVRNGGIPDWVVDQSTLIRSNDPLYMSFVSSFWTELAERVNGSVFKQGGPVIGVQLENEYSLNRPGQGAAHIATLKSLAMSLGFDVPLYTCTGWQGTHYPPNQVIPVFGGYQDAPWDVLLVDEPPNETFSFRYFSRESGSYGYPAKSSNPNSQSQLAGYPFLTAEYGGGAGVMYRRRVVLDLPDDVAATIPVQLGSGVNLYGYYMFHGGTNPRGETETLQESTETGGYNDLPIFNYDYMAPLGQYGQHRPTLNRIKQYHYWLNDFGSQLAGMSVRRPAVIANSSTDLSSLRWSVRSDGKRGYLFVNNYVRQYSMASHNVQFAIEFSSGTVTLPEEPVTITNGAYFIWPLNLALGNASLVYATAQLLTSLRTPEKMVFVFVAVDGIPVEFAFSTDTVTRVEAIAGTVSKDSAGHSLVKSILPGLGVAIDLTDKDDNNISVIVVDQTTADDLWQLRIKGQKTLILTKQAVRPTASGFELSSVGSLNFSFASFPAFLYSTTAVQLPSRNETHSLFTITEYSVWPKNVSAKATLFRAPGTAPPVLIGGQAGGALQPNETVIEGTQGLWSIQIPWSEVASVDDAFLMISYEGDLARLYFGSQLLDDHFYDGTTWVVGLKRFAGLVGGGNLTLSIMPLRSDAPIYLPVTPTYDANGQSCALTNITVSVLHHLSVDVK